MPETTRVQLSRAAGWRMPSDAAKVDRSTEYGNPFAIVGPVKDIKTGEVEWWVESASSVWRFKTKPEAQAAAVRLYDAWIMHPGQSLLRDRIRLRFKRTRPACWCKIGSPCHGDIVARVAATPLECEAA